MIFAAAFRVGGRQLVASIWPTGEGPWLFTTTTVREDGQYMLLSEHHPTRQGAQARLADFTPGEAAAVMARMLEVENRTDLAVATVRGEGKALQ